MVFVRQGIKFLVPPMFWVPLLLVFFWSTVSPLAETRTLRVAVASRVPSLGNPFASIISGGIHPSELTFDALVKLAPNGQILPMLATYWEAINPTTWMFVLREGVEFSNGEPFNAYAVVAALKYLKTSGAQKYFLSAEVRGIESFRAIDDYTLEIRTSTPDAILPNRLSMFLMVPPRAWAEMGPDEFGLSPIGTGSFVLTDWGMQTGRYVLELNTKSWRTSKHIDRVEFVLLAEQTSRAQALMAGQIDIAYQVGFEDMESLEGMGFQIFTRLGAQVGGLTLPNIHKDSPLYDRRVRWALNHAINREEISKFLYKGVSPPVGQGAIPGVFGYNPDIQPYEFNPTKARALLAEAGYPKGFELDAKVLVQGLPEQAAMYQRVAQDLAEVGVKVDFRAVPGPNWIRIWYSGDWEGADIISHTHNSNSYYDVIRVIENFSCKKAGAFFCLPDMLPIIEASNVNFDRASRERQLQDMMTQFHDLAPSIILFPQPNIFAMTQQVQNLVFERERVQVDQIIMID